MSSRAAVLSAKPRVRRAPRAASNEVDDAVFLASSYGLTPDDWQEDVLESWLGRRADGRWAAATGGLAVSRQNGKNGCIEVRELFGVVALGERFLHTAHEVKTARKGFLRIASFFENERAYPELAALVKEIRKTNGQEAVVLANGGSVEFIARSRGSGRGFTVDVLVCDEAQELTSEELEALLPTVSAAPSGNPQVIFTGTPPKPGRVQGEVFRTLRSTGEANADARLAWTDFGAPDGPLPDVDDRAEWFARNPGLGVGRLQIAEVERERALMLDNPAGFARERLGWWGDPAEAIGGVITRYTWDALLRDPPSDPVTGIGVDRTPDQEWCSVGVFAGNAVDVVEHRPGASWVVEVCRKLHEAHHAPIAIDPRGPAASVIADLKDAGLPVVEPKTQDCIRACSAFLDAVKDGGVSHGGTSSLTAAVESARKRLVGDGWLWDRKTGGSPISPLVAVTLARWVAHNNDSGGGWMVSL